MDVEPSEVGGDVGFFITSKVSDGAFGVVRDHVARAC